MRQASFGSSTRIALVGLVFVAVGCALYIGWMVSVSWCARKGVRERTLITTEPTFSQGGTTKALASVTALDLRLRARYGKTLNRNAIECSDEFGIGMLTAWRKARFTLCSARNDREVSSVDCRVRHAHMHSRFTCAMQWVQLRKAEPPDYFPQMDGQCSTDLRDKWFREDKYKEAAGTKYAQSLRGLTAPLVCNPTNTVNHTVLWVPRWDGVNVYHSTEDLITMFVTCMVTGDDPKDVEVVFFDSNLHIPTQKLTLLPLMRLLFRNVRVVSDTPFPEGTCFRRAVMGVHAGASHLSHNGGVSKPSKCHTTSPILRVFVDWVRTAVGLRRRGDKKVKCAADYRSVIFVSRRAPMHRVLPNEAEVVARINASLPLGWHVQVVAFELVGNVVDQIRLAANTSVLVGVHGAALTHSMFLPREGQLVEVFYGDRSEANKHYLNIARWMGLGYMPVNAGMVGNINSKVVADAVAKAVRKTRSRCR